MSMNFLMFLEEEKNQNDLQFTKVVYNGRKGKVGIMRTTRWRELQ